MSELAQVHRLSPSTKAIAAYHGSGKLLSLTFIRGREAFILSDHEAEKLRAVYEREKVEA